MTKKDTPTHPWLMERRYFSLIIVSAFVILSTSSFLHMLSTSYDQH